MSRIKFVFTLLYLIYFSFTYTVGDYFLPGVTTFIYTILIYAGVAIMLLDFFLSGILFRFRYSWMLIVFYIFCVVSVLMNIAYDPYGNLKMVMWMLVQTFVIATVNGEYKDLLHVNRFCIIVEVIAALWLVSAIASIVIFILGYYNFFPYDNRVGYLSMGFLLGRLFGVYDDPNYASLCVLFIMILLICKMIMKKESKALRRYHIFVLITDFIYIVLAASRTTELCLYIAAAFIGFFLVCHFIRRKGVEGIKRYLISIVAAVMCVAVSMGVYTASGFALGELYVATSFCRINFDPNHDYAQDLLRPDVESGDVSNNRFAIWKDYLEIYEQKPVFGIGPRNGLTYINKLMPDSFVAEKKYSFHNGYLSLLMGSGAIGAVVMLLFLALKAKTIVFYVFRKNGSDDKYYVPIVLMTAVLATAAIGAFPLWALFFHNTFYDIIFWFIFGYAGSLIHITEPDKYPKEPFLYRITEKFRIKTK